jgi:hypothetical protein
MKTRLIIFVATLVFCLPAFSQTVEPDWVYILDGFQDADVTGLQVDDEGNTYVSANYSGTLSLTGLKKELPRSPHVFGLLLKLDKKGKLIWANPIESANDNRISDLALAPNGDVLITGFADGVVKVNGSNGSLEFGRPKQQREYHQPQNVYAARFDKTGKAVWVQYFPTPWGEGMSIAVNSKNETYLNAYFKGHIKYDGVQLDTVSRDKRSEQKSICIHLDAEGKLIDSKPVYDIWGTSYIPRNFIFIDNQDNLYQYGTFQKSIYFTENDSIANDPGLESLDSFVAKYNANGEFQWARKIGGQHTQWLRSIDVDKNGNVLGTGQFTYECTFGDGVELMQKSKLEYHGGSSMFYFSFNAEGELNFARYDEPRRKGLYLMGMDLAIDDNNHTHIIGSSNDTVEIDGLRQDIEFGAERYFHTSWKEDKLLSLSLHGLSSNSFILARKIGIGGNQFASCGLYVGNEAKATIKGKKHSLTVRDYGRSSFIIGGHIPELTVRDSIPYLAALRKLRLDVLKPLLACVNSEKEAEPGIWFPTLDSIPSRETWLQQSPCGRELDDKAVKLFPNPSHGSTSLELVGMQGGFASIDIFSETGKLIFSQRINVIENTHVLNLNLSHQASGVYFVRIVHGGYEKALRLVKN